MSIFAWCVHAELSDAIDGSRICLRCGAAIREPNIRADMLNACELIRRDHGRYGRHSQRCMEIDGEWCCADDCTLA